MVEKKIKIIVFCDMRKLHKIQISASVIKFYWNTAVLLCFSVVHGYFCATMTTLSSCIWPAKPKILTKWPFIEKYLLTGPLIP